MARCWRGNPFELSQRVHDPAIRLSHFSPPDLSHPATGGWMKNPRVRVELRRDRSTHRAELLDQPRRDPRRSARVQRRIGRPIVVHPSIVKATRRHLPEPVPDARAQRHFRAPGATMIDRICMYKVRGVWVDSSTWRSGEFGEAGRAESETALGVRGGPRCEVDQGMAERGG